MQSKVESVEDFKARQQLVFAGWMEQACAGHEFVRVTRKATPFGVFVMSVEPVSASDVPATEGE